MKAYVCKVCGYIHFGEEAPERCPQCGAGKEAFVERQESEGAKQYADEHRIGVAQGLDEEIVSKDCSNPFSVTYCLNVENSKPSFRLHLGHTFPSDT